MTVVQDDNPECIETIIDVSGCVDPVVPDGKVDFVLSVMDGLHRLHYRMVPSFLPQCFVRAMIQGDEVFLRRKFEKLTVCKPDVRIIERLRELAMILFVESFDKR